MRQRTISILLVEDEAEYAELLIDMLNTSSDAQFIPTHVTNLTAAVQRLAENMYDIVLLDLHLPDSDGDEGFTRLSQKAPQVPIIIITSHDDREFAESAVRMGVQDYLLKGKVNRGHLTRAIFYAIERKRAFDQAQHLAAYEERQRLARDLHDSVSQTLFSVTMIAETLLHLHGNQSEPLRHGLEDLHRLTKGARSELQTLLLELRPNTLIESPLDRLLMTLTNALRSRTKANCTLPPTVQLVFYRVAQEAFNNITKHAQASAINVILQRGEDSDDSFTLRITDNGQGLTMQETLGMGLKIMRERAASIGAELLIESQKAQGTTIMLKWHPE
jgi:signal transduction histidine kinase